jgi:hypothetical protein
MTSLSIEDIDEMLDNIGSGPKVIWVPPGVHVRLRESTAPRGSAPSSRGPSFFGRKRRARRLRPRIRQHRAYMANVRAFAERLHLQALRSRQEADRQSRLVRDIRCLPLVPLVTPGPHAPDPR